MSGSCWSILPRNTCCDIRVVMSRSLTSRTRSASNASPSSTVSSLFCPVSSSLYSLSSRSGCHPSLLLKSSLVRPLRPMHVNILDALSADVRYQCQRRFIVVKRVMRCIREQNVFKCVVLVVSYVK